MRKLMVVALGLGAAVATPLPAAPPIFRTGPTTAAAAAQSRPMAYGQPVPATKRTGWDRFPHVKRMLFGDPQPAGPAAGAFAPRPPHAATAHAGTVTPFPAVAPQHAAGGPVGGTVADPPGGERRVGQRLTRAITDNPLTDALGDVRLTGNRLTDNRLTRALAGGRSTSRADDALSLSRPVGEPTPDLLLAMARVAAGAGDTAAARRLLRQAIQADPTGVDALRQLARLEDAEGRLVQAERLYLQAVAADPTSATALNDLGLCYARQGKLPQSRATLERAIRLRPDKVLYRNNVAKVLVGQGDPERAAAHLAAVHGRVAAEYNVGQLLIASGDTAAGTRRVQRAAALDPGFTPAVEALARLAPAAGPAANPARAQLAHTEPAHAQPVQIQPAGVENGGPVEQVATRPAPASPERESVTLPLPSLPR